MCTSLFGMQFGGVVVHIGIDLGGSHCKVMSLKQSWWGSQPLGVAEVPIPPGAVTSHGLTQLPELSQAVQQALQLAQPHHRPSRDVVSAVPASFVLTKLLEFPIMPHRELAEAIHFEVSQAFPVPIEELSIDWITLPRSAPSPNHQAAATKPTDQAAATPLPPAAMEIFVMGAPRGLVESYAQFFQNLHLNLIALEIKPLANARAVLGSADSGPLLLVDIGARDTSLVVMEGGELRHLSSLDFGGESINPPPPGPGPLAEIKDERSKMRDQRTKKTDADLRPKLNPLVEEIDHVVKFYEHRTLTAQRLKHLRLCGGGALLSGIAPTLHELTGLETLLADPTRHLNSTINFPGAASLPFTTAIGLALHP